MATNDDIIASLEAERESIVERMAAIDAAINALDGTRPVNGTGRRRAPRGSVGADKLDAIRAYIRERDGKLVRQAEIGPALGLNTGTVSTAVTVLESNGEIEAGQKLNRSLTWRAVA